MSQQRSAWHRWRELCERQPGSGLSVAAFCARQGVGVSSFYAWRRRLAKAAPSAFVELTTQAAQPSPIEVVLPGGVRLRVRAGFDATTLRQAVEALS